MGDINKINNILQAYFDARPKHLWSFDERFCGSKERYRPVAHTDEQVTCKTCLMNMAQAEIDAQGLELVGKESGICRGKKVYILYKKGKQCGSPYFSKKSLDASIAIDRKFNPYVSLAVEVFEIQAVDWYIVPVRVVDKIEN